MIVFPNRIIDTGGIQTRTRMVNKFEEDDTCKTTFYNSAPTGLFVMTLDGQLVATNSEFDAIMGDICVEDLKERKDSLLSPALIDMILINRKVTDYEIEVNAPACAAKLVSITAKFSAAEGIIEGSLIDVTHRLEAKTELVQALKDISRKARQRVEQLRMAVA